MGIHGEPGIERVPIMPVDSIVDRMINTIVADEQHGG
jgi:dihydroxyacetone kinase